MDALAGAFQIGSSSVTDYLEALYARAELDQAEELRQTAMQAKKRGRKSQSASALTGATAGPSHAVPTPDAAAVKRASLPTPTEDENTSRRASSKRRARSPSARDVAVVGSPTGRHPPNVHAETVAVLDDSSAPAARAKPRAKPKPSGGIRNPSSPCTNCQAADTPLWRTDGAGNNLCNACGIYAKTHGSARPLEVIAHPGPKILPSPGGPCSNCQATEAPVWRTDGAGNSLCNACGIYAKTHGSARPPEIIAHPGSRILPSPGAGAGASSAAGRAPSSTSSSSADDVKPSVGHLKRHAGYLKAVPDPDADAATGRASKRRRMSPSLPRALSSTSAPARFAFKAPVDDDDVASDQSPKTKGGSAAGQLRSAQTAKTPQRLPIKRESDASPGSLSAEDTKAIILQQNTSEEDDQLGLFPPPSLLRLAHPLSSTASEAASASASRQSSLTPLPDDPPARPHCAHCRSTKSSNGSWSTSKLGSGKLCNACYMYETRHSRCRPLALIQAAQGSRSWK